MPRSTSINARRFMNGKILARKHGERVPSLADAYDDYLGDIIVSDDVRRIVQTRRDTLARVRFVSAKGLAALVEPAIKEYEETTGDHNFPHNFVRSQMSGSVGCVGSIGRKLSQTDANIEIEKFARLGGWIKAAAKLPGIRRLLRKGMSSRGMNSPYTYTTPHELAARFPSPGRFERLLWATKARATAILSAYDGNIKPSWVNLSAALEHETRIG